MEPIPAILFRGLGRTTPSSPERMLTTYYRHHNIDLTNGEINWHDSQEFNDIFDLATFQSANILQKKGRLAILGFSAGGSLGVNVYQRLLCLDPNANVSMVSLSGWLQNDDPGRLRYIGLNRAPRKSSRAFIESVERCTDIAIPFLPETAKDNMTTVIPRYDGVVPISSMLIEGVQAYTVPAISHMGGIVVGAMHVPTILESQPSLSTS